MDCNELRYHIDNCALGVIQNCKPSALISTLVNNKYELFKHSCDDWRIKKLIIVKYFIDVFNENGVVIPEYALVRIN